MRGKPSSIFALTPQKIAPPAPRKSEYSFDDWIEGVKLQARKNLEDFWERSRIEWCSRFKIPKYDKFEKYSREELLCELYEQFYLDNPDNLELKGVHKKVDAETGLSYYVTGDAVIDEMERTFAKGVVPDMDDVFGRRMEEAKRIWDEPIFETEEGTKISASILQDGAPKDGSGKFVTQAGTSAHKTDFSSDDWLEDALKDDPVIKAMKENMGV